MAKKSTQASQVTASYQGDYINDMVDTLVASALSGVHAVLLSKPGYGKTRVAAQVAQAIYGKRIEKDLNGKSEGEWAFLRLEASTPPEEVKGLPDPAAMIATPPRIEYNRNGTLYDPRANLLLVDEGFRANDVVFDTFLDALDRQDYLIDQAPVIWMTSNFVASGDRLAAVRDRIGIWAWFTPIVMWRDVSMAHLNREYGHELAIPTGDIPTKERIVAIRSMKPTLRAAKIVAEMANTLAVDAISGMGTAEHVNPRRIQQWSKIMFAVSAHNYDTDDIATVHPKAINAIKSAWPSYNNETYRRWEELVDKVSDVIGAAIAAAKQSAYQGFSNAVDSNEPNSAKIEMLGKTMEEATQTIEILSRSMNNSDKRRADSALDSIRNAYAESVGLITSGGS